MRIAFLSADHGIAVTGDKGAAAHIRAVVHAMLDLGHEVELFAARVGTAPERLRVAPVKIRAPLEEEGPGEPEGEDPRSRRLVKERRYLAVAAAMEAAVAAAHAVRPFDLLYERHSLWSAAAVRLGRRLGIPSVVEMNAPLVDEQARWRQLVLADRAAAIERELCAGASLIVAVSEGVAQHVRGLGAPAERVLVVPNGVDTERFGPEGPRLELPDGAAGPVVGFVGSLKPWHGVELLLEAFREVVRFRPEAHLLLVGDGPLRPWIEGWIAGADLAGRVTLTGWLPHEELAPAIRRFDVAVAPYPPLDRFYFSPLKLFEYLACGVPVVASSIGQIPEFVRDGVEGLLVPPGDIGALARTLDGLLADRPRRVRMGRAAATRAREFDWRGKVARILAHVATPAALPAGGG